MICPLCNKNSDIVESHIIPSFLYQWFKETSGTGHMRSGENPNLRVQDGIKYDLLCKTCEEMISKWEKLFSEEIFKIICDDKPHCIRYGKWLSKFAASLCWRILFHFKKNNTVKKLSKDTQIQVEKALDTWSSFIHDNIKNPGEFELHFIRLGLIEKRPSDSSIPPNINRYFTRTIDIDIPEGENISFVYAKLCHCLFLGIVKKSDKVVFKNTLIHITKGFIRKTNMVLPGHFFHYLNERANNARRIYVSINQKQKKHISDTFKKNLDRLAESNLFKALNQDVMLFGDDAFLDADKE